jgi:hypothetical protein
MNVLQINSSGMMSIILAGAIWFVLLPNAADLCGLVGLRQGLFALQVGDIYARFPLTLKRASSLLLTQVPFALAVFLSAR